MTDSILLFPAGYRVLDANGAPVSGAQVRFFVAGTSTPKTVYSDSGLSVSLGSIVYTRSDGYLVASQFSNTTVAVYTGSALYKVDILDANSVTIYPAKDNVKGAVDTSTFLTSSSTSTLVIPVTAIATDTTLTTTHKGSLVHSSGNITLTLDTPATLTNGWSVKIRCNDSTNPTKIVASSGTIKGPGFSVAALALSGLGAEVELVCDGGNIVVANRLAGLPVQNGRLWTVTSSVSSAPATTPGNWYLVSAAFGAFSTGDIIEATGQATFIGYTPPTNSGWLLYNQATGIYSHHVTGGWVSYTDSPEIATPANPPADTLRTYAKDVGGATQFFSLDSAGQETNLSHVPSRAYLEYSSNVDLSTTIPLDDTVPQSSEGTQILSVSITPKRTTSRIRVRFQGFGEVGTGSHIIAALFKDAGANALSAVALRLSTTTSPQPFGLEFEHAPGGTSAMTYAINVGANSGTMRMNGTNAARYFGGVGISTLVVEEVFT